MRIMEICFLQMHWNLGTSLHGCRTTNAYGVKNLIMNINNHNKIKGFCDLLQIQSSMIYTPDQIIDTFHQLLEPDKKLINKKIKEIDGHFDKMAEIIMSPREKEKSC